MLKRSPLRNALFCWFLTVLASVGCLSALGAMTGCGLFTKSQEIIRPAARFVSLANALDEDYFHSPLGDVAARYPKGWLHVDISTVPMQNVLEVYTDSARSRALILSEIPATAEFRRSMERDGMAALADQSFAMKSNHVPGTLTITRPTEIYTVNGKLFASYQYGDATGDTLHRREHRIELFTTGAKCYEIGMIELTPPADPAQHIQNFQLLESVIGTVEGAAFVRAADSTSF